MPENTLMPENTVMSDSSAGLKTTAEKEPTEKKNRYYLASAPIWRALIHLCIPMIAGLSVGVVYNVVNAGFVGSLHSTPLLAALTFSLPVLTLLMAVGGVFGVGGGTYLSRLLGAEEAQDDAGRAATALRAKQVSAFTLWGAVAGGVVVAVLGLLLLGPITAALGASGDAAIPTAQYVGVLLAFAPALVSAFALEQVVRAEGAATASMVGIVASTIANLVLDVLFILVLGWGVVGAGLAIGLSNVVMVAWYAYYLHRHSTTSVLSPRWLHVDRELLRTVFGVGVSELLMTSFLLVSSLLLNWVAVAYGDAVIAGFGVALRISQLPEMLCMGVFMGAIPLYAYAFGAGRSDRLRAAIRASAIAIAAITLVFSTAVFLLREPIMTLFSDDPSVLTDGVLILTAMLVSTVFNGFTGLIVAVFQATGQMRNAAIMSVVQGVVFIPVLLGGRAPFGLTGVIWAATVAELAAFALGLTLYVLSRRNRA